MKALTDAGVSVWYDREVLEWGDRLRPKINEGLIKSDYAIAVLSKAYLAKRKWTEHELDSLFAREELGQIIILPIWHGVVRKDLLEYDPSLADRLAKISETDSYNEIVRSVLRKLGRSKEASSDHSVSAEQVAWPSGKKELNSTSADHQSQRHGLCWKRPRIASTMAPATTLQVDLRYVTAASETMVSNV